MANIGCERCNEGLTADEGFAIRPTRRSLVSKGQQVTFAYRLTRLTAITYRRRTDHADREEGADMADHLHRGQGSLSQGGRTPRLRQGQGRGRPRHGHRRSRLVRHAARGRRPGRAEMFDRTTSLFVLLADRQTCPQLLRF